jgi:nucleoid DNA-binding protein
MAAAKKKSMKSTARKMTKASASTRKAKLGPISKTYTKTEIYSAISDQTELSKKQVASVFDTLGNVIEGHLKKGHTFVLPGYFKCQLIRKPATKARKGINPFNGEPTIFKAKPARNLVKLRALKKLKDMV